MKLDFKTVKDIKSYREGVLSFIDDRGYPYSIRSRFDLKEPENCIEMRRPKSLRQKLTPDQKACVIFHHHDDKLDHQRQLLLRGVVNEQDNKLIFAPQHASALDTRGTKNMMMFLLKGRSATSEYFKRRGMKKPDLRYKPDPAFWRTYNTEHA